MLHPSATGSNGGASEVARCAGAAGSSDMMTASAFFGECLGASGVYDVPARKDGLGAALGVIAGFLEVG